MNDDLKQAALEGAYRVRIGDWVSRGWDLLTANPWPYILFALLNCLIQAAGRGIIGFIIGAHLTAGFFIAALKQMRGEKIEFGDFWKAFNVFVPFFLAGLVVKVLVLFGLLFCLVPGIYLAVSYLLVYPILWETRMDFWEAMELSRKVITKQWFSWLGLALVLILINLAGVLLCLVGIFFTIPLTYFILAVAYEEVLGGSSAAPRNSAPPPSVRPSVS